MVAESFLSEQEAALVVERMNGHVPPVLVMFGLKEKVAVGVPVLVEGHGPVVLLNTQLSVYEYMVFFPFTHVS